VDISLNFVSLTSYALICSFILGRDKNKKFSDFNFEQQGRIIEFWFDAMHLKSVNPSRQHHQKSLQLLPSIQIILSNFLKNPSDPTLLPSP